MADLKDTIDDIFKEVHTKINTNLATGSISSVERDGIILYSYQSFRERKRNELFEIMSHLSPSIIEDKLQRFIYKDEIIVKNKEVYYPALQVPLDKDISAKEFYEKTKSFFRNFEYELHWTNPMKIVYQGLSKVVKTKRRKYGYETEAFFNSKESLRKLCVMGTIYKKDGKMYLELASESPQQIIEYTNKLIKNNILGGMKNEA